jgi:hypothetical protein
VLKNMQLPRMITTSLVPTASSELHVADTKK